MIYEKEKHQTVNKIKRALKATYLCWKYPFLTHKVDEGKFIKTTCWYFSVPEGWRSVALQMFQEIKDSIKRDGGSFRIYDVKEKNGYLDVDCGATEDIHNIVLKYEYITEHTCIRCGRPAYYYTEGWVAPYCKKHAPKGVSLRKYGTEEDKWYGAYTVGLSSNPIILE